MSLFAKVFDRASPQQWGEILSELPRTFLMYLWIIYEYSTYYENKDKPFVKKMCIKKTISEKISSNCVATHYAE